MKISPQQGGQPFRILHVVSSIGVGGMEKRIERLARGLAAEGDYHIDVLGLKPARGLTISLPEPGNLLEHPIEPGLHFGALIALARRIRAGRYHLVHTHNWASMFYGVLAARLAGARWVLHGEHGLNAGDLAGAGWKRRAAQRLLGRLVTCVVAVNRPIAAQVRADWGAGLALEVIPNGVDLTRFRPALPPETEAFVLGTVARLDAVKNLSCLIEAVALLRKEGIACRARLVGEGPEEAALRALADTLGCAEAVEFCGPSSRPEEFYATFHAYVNCSIYEGMSNTVLEAMACGLPVLASDVEGHRTWLRETGQARFFDPRSPRALAEAIKPWAADRVAASRQGADNRRFVEAHYDNAAFVRAYAELYARLRSGA